MHHETIRLAQKYKRLKNSELLILNQKNNKETTHEGKFELIDSIACKIDVLSQIEDNFFVETTLSLLNDKQKTVVSAIILEGFTEKEIAVLLNISQPAVNKIKYRALKRLRKQLQQ